MGEGGWRWCAGSSVGVVVLVWTEDRWWWSGDSGGMDGGLGSGGGSGVECGGVGGGVMLVVVVGHVW